MESSLQDFEQFWNNYPVHRGMSKHTALVAWGNLIYMEELNVEEVIRAAKNYSVYCKKEKIRAQYTKHATRWLHERLWENFLEDDEVVETQKTSEQRRDKLWSLIWDSVYESGLHPTFQPKEFKHFSERASARFGIPMKKIEEACAHGKTKQDIYDRLR